MPRFGPAQTLQAARALQQGRVFCSLHRLPDDIRARLHTISPNVKLVFDRWAIDPYRVRFEVTLHTDGTIRGLGGVRVMSESCATAVPGLFVAGDNASREKVAGATSGGGNVNSAWALSSGLFAGRGAARLARSRASRHDRLAPLGRAGLRAGGGTRPVDLHAARDAVRLEMQSFDRALFRTAQGLLTSRQTLDTAWRELAGSAEGRDLKSRETASLLATARWSVTAALERRESRGMHLRLDAPDLDPELGHRLIVAGLEEIGTSWDVSAAVPLREAVG